MKKGIKFRDFSVLNFLSFFKRYDFFKISRWTQAMCELSQVIIQKELARNNLCISRYISWALCHLASLTSQTRFTLCRLTWSGFRIHLITALSVIRRLSLYEFTLWGRDLMSIVRIREIIEVYFKEKYENFVGTLETVRNREVIEGWGL